MSDDRDKEFWASLERRLSDLASSTAQLQRDYQRDVTQLTHEVKEITNRVNLGLSNSVHNVEVDNVKIKLAQSEQSAAFDKSLAQMAEKVREYTELTQLLVKNSEKNADLKLGNFEKDQLAPVKDEVGLMKRTFIYGLAGAVIVFLGQKVINIGWDAVIKPRPTVIAPAP